MTPPPDVPTEAALVEPTEQFLHQSGPRANSIVMGP
jgi:hypothetical protein